MYSAYVWAEQVTFSSLCYVRILDYPCFLLNADGEQNAKGWWNSYFNNILQYYIWRKGFYWWFRFISNIFTFIHRDVCITKVMQSSYSFQVPYCFQAQYPDNRFYLRCTDHDVQPNVLNDHYHYLWQFLTDLYLFRVFIKFGRHRTEFNSKESIRRLNLLLWCVSTNKPLSHSFINYKPMYTKLQEQRVGTLNCYRKSNKIPNYLWFYTYYK